MCSSDKLFIESNHKNIRISGSEKPFNSSYIAEWTQDADTKAEEDGQCTSGNRIIIYEMSRALGNHAVSKSFCSADSLSNLRMSDLMLPVGPQFENKLRLIQSNLSPCI
jgi:hypothetical protein